MATGAVTPAEPIAVDAGSPAEPVVQQPVTTPNANDAAQAVRPDQQQAPSDDAKLLEALGITEDATAEPAAEPAEATNIAPEFLASLQERSQYIQSEADVERAAIAADNVWRTIDGQLSITDLFEALRSENKLAFDRMMADAIEYVSQVTGKPVAQNAAGAAETPEMQRIARLESALTEQRQAQENAAFAQRVQTVKEQAFMPAVKKALEGTFLVNDQPFVVQQLGQKFAGKEMELIAQLERGDTSKLDAAVKSLQKEWRDRFNGWAKQIMAQRKSLAGALPKVNGDGQSQRGESAAKPEFDLETKEGRLKYMAAMAPGKS
jgi:hypothetical protein